MSNVDTLLHSSFLRRGSPPDEALPPDVVARFLVTKTSWRGRYRRVLAVTPTAILTQHPDDLAITNTWAFVGDSDLDDAAPGSGAGEDQELVLYVRKDAWVGVVHGWSCSLSAWRTCVAAAWRMGMCSGESGCSMPAYRMRPMYVLSSSGGRLHHGLRQSYFSVSQSKHKPTKFACKQRGALLTVLYQCLAAAGGACPITRKVLGCVWSRRFR